MPALRALKVEFARFARRLRRPAAILVYHRVARLEADPYKLAVTPEHFVEHLDALQRHCALIPLRELVGRLGGGRWPRRAVSITFDDGYADMLHQIAPLLERYGIPATAFIATGVVASQREFWWDELEYLSSHFRRPAAADLYDALLSLDASGREDMLDRLFTEAGRKRVTRPTHRPLNAAEVVQLAQSGLIDIGAHTVNHPMLARIPLGEQRREIEDSRKALQALTGKVVDQFAYPFGQRAHYTEQTIALLRESGFVLACGNFPGPVGRSTDQYELPRYQARDVDGDRLLHWLLSSVF